jgi:pimeloyl-ACP methyl ester carboxylesterase
VEIHLVPGVAADAALFSRLSLPGHALHVLALPTMPEGSTITDYAGVLAQQVDAGVPHALLGVSMGGMCVQEMAAVTGAHKVIIISSWKGPHEMPAVLHALRGTHPERVLTPKLVERIKPVLYWQMGAEDEERKALIDGFIARMPLEQIKVQLNASLNWNGPPAPVKGLVHIHGENDRLMPISSITGAIPVAGGGHLMVHDRAAEVAAIVGAQLEQS